MIFFLSHSSIWTSHSVASLFFLFFLSRNIGLHQLQYSNTESVFLSKDPETGYAGAQYIYPNDWFRVTNHFSVYATELLAILLALQWIEEKKINNTVIESDSYSSLESIRSGKSSFRMDIINEIFRMKYNRPIKVVGGYIYTLHLCFCSCWCGGKWEGGYFG